MKNCSREIAKELDLLIVEIEKEWRLKNPLIKKEKTKKRKQKNKSKKCDKCGEKKEIDCFSKDVFYLITKTKDGALTTCKDCINLILDPSGKKTERIRKRKLKELEYEDSKKQRYRKIMNTRDGTITKESLALLLSLQNNKCYHCSIELDRTKELDHYFPISKGGEDSITNVCWSCKSCNRSKSAKVPKTLMLI